MSFRWSSLATLLLACVLLTIAWWAYAPGLRGDFLFDDFGNLPSLGDSGPVDNWATFCRYITSGQADPIGRPIALLSFLLDANDWPASPYPFKRTNLVLHLSNGVLLALLLRRLGREALPARVHTRTDLAAVIGAALWLLHPLLVSTTLYIVQREAMLPASFTLIGLLLWLYGRRTLLRGHQRRGLCWVLAGLGGCTALALLSKANGLLLPALALVIEYTWLPHPKPVDQIVPVPEAAPRSLLAYRRSMLLLAWLPTTVLAAYLLEAGWNGFVHGVSALRPWTLGQRLLTEARVLMDYLNLLWLPRPFTPGLFNDQITASMSLWSPLTTLPALLAVGGMVASAGYFRRRFPALALAILFYFVGQSMESTTLQLELYFEHRNYLPAMVMFWPLALWLVDIPIRDRSLVRIDQPGVPSNTLKWGPLLRGGLAILLLSGLALMTHARAALWGNGHDQALLWARLNPSSPRAQANAALFEMAAGNASEAGTRLAAALPTNPDQLQLSFNLIGAHCMLGQVHKMDLDMARLAISRTRDPGTLLVHWFDSSIDAAENGRCRGLDLASLDALLDSGLNNKKLVAVDGRHQDLLYLKGHIALAKRDPASALRDFNLALDMDPRPGAALNQAALLGAAGYPQEGLVHLNHFRASSIEQPLPSSGMPWLHAWVLQHQNYWQNELLHLRATLHDDAARQNHNTE